LNGVPVGSVYKNDSKTSNLRPRRGAREPPRQSNVILSTHDKLTAATALPRLDVIRRACAETVGNVSVEASLWQLNSTYSNIFGGLLCAGLASRKPGSRMPAVPVNDASPSLDSGRRLSQEEGGP
jgi:hypothetical protein